MERTEEGERGWGLGRGRRGGYKIYEWALVVRM
jgi:hypothetical protein